MNKDQYILFGAYLAINRCSEVIRKYDNGQPVIRKFEAIKLQIEEVYGNNKCSNIKDIKW